MSLLRNIIINSYSILILLIICINSLRIFEKTSLQDQIYMMILYAAIVMLVLDVLSRLDGNAQAFYPLLNTIGNFLIFALNSVLASLWLTYVHLYVFNNEMYVIIQYSDDLYSEYSERELSKEDYKIFKSDRMVKLIRSVPTKPNEIEYRTD